MIKQLLFLLFMFLSTQTFAQCSVCTRTAQQMGEKPAQALNSGILYLMLIPFFIMAFIGFMAYKNNKQTTL
jgi:large-conductance mechanosensitive channel